MGISKTYGPAAGPHTFRIKNEARSERGRFEFRRALRIPRLYFFVGEEFCLRADALHDGCGVDEAAHERFVGYKSARDVRDGGRGRRISRSGARDRRRLI